MHLIWNFKYSGIEYDVKLIRLDQIMIWIGEYSSPIAGNLLVRFY
jgi:hypothetical protein